MPGQLGTLRWQFDLAWKLAQYHLPQLTDEACLWEPEAGSWTVRNADGVWQADWAATEPDPVPPASIGWLTWHIIWWWSGLLAAVLGTTPVRREDVFWPGTARAAVARIEAIASDWTSVLERLQESVLDRPLSYPWREPRPLGIAIAWANVELIKNVSEIGYARHIFEFRSRASLERVAGPG